MSSTEIPIIPDCVFKEGQHCLLSPKKCIFYDASKSVAEEYQTLQELREVETAIKAIERPHPVELLQLRRVSRLVSTSLRVFTRVREARSRIVGICERNKAGQTG